MNTAALQIEVESFGAVSTRDEALVAFLGRFGVASMRQVMAQFGIGRTAAYRLAAACAETATPSVASGGAEVLHDPALPWDGFGGLGEDEIVAVMERPGVTGNPEVARAIVRGFGAQLESDPDLTSLRMQLMRDAMKRLTRLTPFTMLDVLPRAEIDRIVEGVMQQAATAVSRTG